MKFLIYKYSFERPQNTYGTLELRLPVAAKILSCQVQHAQICFWVEFAAPDEGEDFEVTTRIFHIIGTGHRFELTSSMSFIATVQQPPFVWHIYEEHK